MKSLEEFENFDKEDNLNSLMAVYTQPKNSEIELILESLNDIGSDEHKLNQMKHAQFLKLIKKQINDMIYKDQEIGYNILLIGKTNFFIIKLIKEIFR